MAVPSPPRSMGLDGGTIITRTDVLRGSSWEAASADDSRSTRGGQVSTSYTHKRRHLDAAARAEVAWTCCALSEEVLGDDVVACALGRLYNREAVLQHLLALRGVSASENAEYAVRGRPSPARRSAATPRSPPHA